MRKTVATIFIVFLFSTTVLTGFVSSVSANPYFEYKAKATPIVTIHSPINGSHTSAVLLNFTVSKPEAWAGTQAVDGMLQYLSSVVIEIDGKQYDQIYAYDNLSSPFEYSAFLDNLTDGPHNLTVRANAYGFSVEMHGLWKYSIPINNSSAAYFTLDTTAPLVSVLSLESKTYEDADLPFKFTVNEPCSKISYVLDRQENVTVSENLTLSGLSIGEHSVTIYAWDAAGNVGCSRTMMFTVVEPASVPVVPVTAVSTVSIITVVCISLLAYLKKSKK